MNPSPDLQIELSGDHDEIAVVRLTRPAKRNALSDSLVLSIRDAFDNLPGSVRAAVLAGEGEHFCAGLDLAELKDRDAGEGLRHSRMWHAALERVQYGPVPVVASLQGAVVGGGAASRPRTTRSMKQRSSLCPKDHAASLSAAAARCASRA